MNKRILIVEDDKNILKLIKYNLEKEGFSVFTAITGEDGLDIVEQEDIDLAILDLMLPKMDGLDLCRKIKQDEFNCSIPVVIVTAKGEEVDRIVGFELGADDYLVKPFSVRELILRVKAILRRKPKEKKPAGKISIGKIELDSQKFKVSINNKNIKLTPMEFKLLKILMLENEKVLSREKLLSEVWGIDSAITTRTVDTHIKHLRQKLGEDGKRIETVRGFGYKFCV
ncbi:MAG: response regulator transcription factor [Candidatus Omnitrophica bacterium]|nr:response regulator transcription factor [Candidatus Omnitrophota bacterium]MCF7891487.1 response regulator transcription factor [Candidatus Omnitrophota bacterium]MCF7895572.1 response regulator transcription factor [Candidatus Omnitrophota bacterium]MCF7897142.1 response regulator transcription factor [Candidatus Omnitrophota bacterium]MCF7908959.1 response regulator transcription factor [Candidatus Omnitrophota bacterium]